MNCIYFWARISKQLTASALALIFAGAAVTRSAKAQNVACPSAGCGPVMVNPIKVYLVYWLPDGFGFDPGAADGIGNYESLTQRFFSDVSNTSYFGYLTQYPGNCPAPCVVENIPNAVAVGGTWVDTQAYPQNAGTVNNPLQESDIVTELRRAISQNQWKLDTNSQVFIFTGVNLLTNAMVEGCSFSNTGSACTSTASFCAYHHATNDGIRYAFMPDAYFNTHGNGCYRNVTYAPNGQLSSDVEVVMMTHEFFETVTDPQLGASWTVPSTGNEIADNCGNSVAGVYLNGNPYVVQQIWSNHSSHCEPQAPPAAQCPVDLTDCTGELRMTCNGPDVGIIFGGGNCRDLSRPGGTCYAGFTGASTVSAGGNVQWIGSITSPNVATVCTQNAAAETCGNFSAPVPTQCGSSSAPPVPQCGPTEKWCLKFTPPRCAPINECLFTAPHL